MNEAEIKITLTPEALQSVEQLLIITDRRRIIRSIKSDSLFQAIIDFDQWLRGEIKYRNHYEWEEVRSKLRETLLESNVILDED